MSKYIGETEKSPYSLVVTPEQRDAILLFDESNVPLGQRSEAKDSHDRKANEDISYLFAYVEFCRELLSNLVFGRLNQAAA